MARLLKTECVVEVNRVSFSMLLPASIIRYALFVFFFSSRRRHTRYWRDWSSDVCSSDLTEYGILNAMTNDGYGLKKSPYETYMAGENNEKSLLMGYNDRDGDLFMVDGGKVNADNYVEKLKEMYPIDYKKIVDLYPAKNDEDAKENLAKIYTAGTFGYGHEVWSNLASKRVPVYRYLFTKSNKTVGSNHTGELYYAYGSIDQAPYLFDESDRELGRIMMGYWINFAKTGNPNGKGLVRWDEYDGTRVMEFGRNVKMIEDTFKDRKSTRLNSSHANISYAVFCLK